MNGDMYIPPRWVMFLQRTWKRLDSKEIGLVDVFIICLTASTLMILHYTQQPTLWMLLWRWLFMLPLMFITALLSNNYDKYNEKFTYAYLIITSGLSVDDKIKALKSHLNTISSNWNKYHRQFQIIVEGNQDLGKKMALLSDLITQILTGKITLPQIIYITIHSFYSIIISSNMLQIDGPYDIMINMIFITILRYAGADMRGLADLMNDFFILLKPGKSTLEVEQDLLGLGEKMKDGCYASFILTETEQIPIKEPCPLEGKIIIKDNIMTKVDGSHFTDKEVELIQAKQLSDSLGEAKIKTDEQRVELVKELNAEKTEPVDQQKTE